ncbi:hypothetical protein PILCRDRAFT_99642 [Piloderma croceum F 1598]|uniref:Uncharacterized protein n=1 Tax=Piloderma croceum (strain F 1598) TaxID=765440 RepID=A0A0C3BZ36_PILCF|nr:hypothetical protein PILCRDRAFT_99642 [Piloderma croceum F 1598]
MSSISLHLSWFTIMIVLIYIRMDLMGYSISISFAIVCFSLTDFPLQKARLRFRLAAWKSSFIPGRFAGPYLGQDIRASSLQ